MGLKLMDKIKNRPSFFAPVILGLLLTAVTPLPSVAQDPNGAQTGTIKDLGVDTLAATKDTAM